LEGNSCLLSSGASDSPVRHRTGPVDCAVRDLLSKFSIFDCCSSGLIGAPDTVRCTSDSPVHQLTVGAVHVSREDCAADRCSGDRWLTGQSGAPPDSPVNFIYVAPLLFPRAMSSPRMTHRTVRCTTGRSRDF
jgi:hypothetical protein